MGLYLLVAAHQSSPGKRDVNHVCVSVCKFLPYEVNRWQSVKINNYRKQSLAQAFVIDHSVIACYCSRKMDCKYGNGNW